MALCVKHMWWDKYSPCIECSENQDGSPSPAPTTEGKEISAMQELIEWLDWEFKLISLKGTDHDRFIVKATSLLAKEDEDKKNKAIAFANFVGNRPLPEYSESTNKWRWWNNNTRQYDFATTEELFTHYSPSKP